MTNIPISQESKTKQENDKIELNQSVHELFSLEKMCINYEQTCTDIQDERLPDPDVLLCLVRTAIAKLDYFQQKYGFKIEAEDLFFIGDMLQFAKKKVFQDAEREEYLKSKGMTAFEST